MGSGAKQSLACQWSRRSAQEAFCFHWQHRKSCSIRCPPRSQWLCAWNDVFTQIGKAANSVSTVADADRQTDRILIARPRLHSMQRGENRLKPRINNYWCNKTVTEFYLRYHMSAITCLCPKYYILTWDHELVQYTWLLFFNGEMFVDFKCEFVR